MSSDQDNSGWFILMAAGAVAAYFLGKNKKSTNKPGSESQKYDEINRTSYNPMLGFDINTTQKEFEDIKSIYQAEKKRQLSKENSELYKLDPSLQEVDRALIDLESSGGFNDLESLHKAIQNFTDTAKRGLENLSNNVQLSYSQQDINNQQVYPNQVQHSICSYCNGRQTFLCPTCRGMTQEYGLQSSSGNNSIDALLSLKNQINYMCKTCNGGGLVRCAYCINS